MLTKRRLQSHRYVKENFTLTSEMFTKTFFKNYAIAGFQGCPGIAGTLTRSDSSLHLYWDKYKINEFDFSNNEATISFNCTLWAEWRGDVATNPTLSVRSNSSAAGPDDTITFHPFDNIVVVISGEKQDPFKPITINDSGEVNGPLDGDCYGLSQISYDLLQMGYDVHYVEEPDGVGYADLSTTDNTEPGSTESLESVLNEIVDGINNRSVTKIGMIGYSHGGGSVYDLAKDLSDIDFGDTDKYKLFTAYIDAVEQARVTSMAETRRPIGSDYHLNLYENNQISPTEGGPGEDTTQSGFERNVTLEEDWGTDLVHGTIDNSPEVEARVLKEITALFPLDTTSDEDIILAGVSTVIPLGDDVA
ncbi:hypothetical protein JWG39_15620 [Desulforhopalus vacuolatus]|uniref:hypothetical protein n=1 Tax=Desulforhopalus vacuolatus TaxID=40414 RepID=UPI0019650121|nr:hypothetical protein [Desulforhopalus vacuolatus]MBM9521249.1 hypothetical protein [Desulforhopalus vacuolatus]